MFPIHHQEVRLNAQEKQPPQQFTQELQPPQLTVSLVQSLQLIVMTPNLNKSSTLAAKFDSSLNEIPVEFQPHHPETTTTGCDELESDERAAFYLFAQQAQNDDDPTTDTNDSDFEIVSVGTCSFKLKTPPDIGTLFAHRVWSGSKLLASYLLEHPQLVCNKRTIEFGAGTALPSLLSLTLGSSISIITDFPDEDVLRSLRETVGYNWNTCSGSSDRVSVLGHKWGSDVQPILDRVQDLHRMKESISTNIASSYEQTDHENPILFHVAILSECLWMHQCHDELAKSIDSLLHPTDGIAIVTYAHHVPGKENDDDEFFRICQRRYHFITEHIRTVSMEYMWDRQKKVDIQLMVMRRSMHFNSKEPALFRKDDC